MKTAVIFALLLSLPTFAQSRPGGGAPGGLTEIKLACKAERIPLVPTTVTLTVRRTGGVAPQYNSDSAKVTSTPKVAGARTTTVELIVKSQNALTATFENKKNSVKAQYDKKAGTAELTLDAMNYNCK